MHAGFGPGLSLLRRCASWAAELEPDIIAVTGDLVARRRAAAGFAAASAELVAAARHAAVAVLGNHDLARGHDPFAQGWDAGDLGGLTLLDGSAVEISIEGHRVCLAGASAERMMYERGYDPSAHVDPDADLASSSATSRMRCPACVRGACSSCSRDTSTVARSACRGPEAASGWHIPPRDP